VSDWEGPLDDLRWHWDSAYLIECFGLGRWVAQRRDSHATIGAEGPDELRDKIAADYAAHPVSRRIAGADQPQPLDCRFRPDG